MCWWTILVGKCFDDKLPSNLVCHCCVLHRDSIICTALIMKQEREAFTTQYLHWSNSYCTYAIKSRRKKKKKREKKVRRKILKSEGQLWLRLPSLSKKQTSKTERSHKLRQWPGGWLWTSPQPASLTFTKHYRTISAELAAREHRSSAPSQWVGEQCWKAAKGSDAQRTKRGNPQEPNPKRESCSRDCTSLSVVSQTFYLGKTLSETQG